MRRGDLNSHKFFFFLVLLAPVVYANIVGFGPFLWMLYHSFFDYDFGKVPLFVGLRNYLLVFTTDPTFYKSLYLSAVFTAACVIVELALGMLIGYLLYKTRLLNSVFTLLLMLPMVITPAVSGIIWRLLFDPLFGHVNYFLSLVGIQGLRWLSDPLGALIAVIVCDIWQWTPFVALVLYAGLTATPPEPIEAAYIDGASEFRTFIHVLIPYLKPLIIICIFFRIVDCFKAFDFIYTLTGGGPGTSTSTLPLLLYLNVFTFYHVGYGSAIGGVLWILLLTTTTLLMRRVGSILMRE